MIASLATLLVVLAAFLVMVSGAFPTPSDIEVRRTAGRLVLAAVGLLFIAVFFAAIPTRYVVIMFAFASLAAFFALEYRRRERHAHVQNFVSYRTSGKKLIDDDEPTLDRQPEDGEDRHEYL